MTDSPYFMEWLARQRLAEARAQATRSALVRSLGRRDPGVRSRRGVGALAVARWLRRSVWPDWAHEPSGSTEGPAA